MSRKKSGSLLSTLGRWVLVTPLVRLTILLRSRARWGFFAVACLAAAVALSHWTWRHFGPEVRRSEQYHVHVEDIVVTSQPPWISAETAVRREVVRDASLEEEMSLLDERLTERIAKAFAMHPWVQRVERVTKHYPAQVVVEVTWRRPVCVVEIDSRLEPVDRHGVLLPGSDLSPKLARRYPRLKGIQSVPFGPVGTPWGDPRVSGAARIAAALQDVWHDLALSHLSASRSPSEGPSGFDYTYELFTRGGTRIQWGFSPETEMAGEPTAADKVARLTSFATEHGSLDHKAGRSPWNLSGRGTLSSLPRSLPR